VINDGIGDSGEIVRAGRAGVVLESAAGEEFERSAHALDSLLADAETATRCRAVATQKFSLAAGVASYGKLYEQLT
jgi:hypothetical protein